MSIVLVSTRDAPAMKDVTDGLDLAGTPWRLEQSTEPGAAFRDLAEPPDAVVLDLSGALGRRAAFRAFAAEARRDPPVPVLALVPRSALGLLDSQVEVDDFAVLPVEAEELRARLLLLGARRKRDGPPLSENPGLLQLGDLRIDTVRYEVWVGQRLVTLTFKEYELLRLLASAPGRVFTREVLLDQVWGYDYFGGTRTVDVHVRRLRSKLEDPEHTFVETVRNVGYRLREDPALR